MLTTLSLLPPFPLAFVRVSSFFLNYFALSMKDCQFGQTSVGGMEPVSLEEIEKLFFSQQFSSSCQLCR
jgi:hypothetical protein